MGLTDFSLHFNQLLSVKKEILRADISGLKIAVDQLLSAVEPDDLNIALNKVNSL
jgi:phosphotransferase system enzyme I (PtsI)